MRLPWSALVLAAVLAFGTGVAAAQPAPGSPAGLAAATDAAQARLAVDHRDRIARAAQKVTLARRYEQELAAVDRLKQQKASWRRDRQLRDAMARSLDTANALASLTQTIARLDARIADDKRRVIAAIDAELPVLPDGTRRRALVVARNAAAPAAPRAKKIVLPDTEIDPLADPEELDQQAAALRASEAELQRQVATLDNQATRLRKAAALRKQHERAGDIVAREDDQPRRGGGNTGGRNAGLADTEDSPAAADGGSPPPAGGGDPGTGGFLGEETALVLADVIDPATGDALRRAGRTSDPGTRATAAQRARDQVVSRLEALRKKRAAIEQRAKQLRTK